MRKTLWTLSPYKNLELWAIISLLSVLESIQNGCMSDSSYLAARMFHIVVCVVFLESINEKVATTSTGLGICLNSYTYMWRVVMEIEVTNDRKSNI